MSKGPGRETSGDGNAATLEVDLQHLDADHIADGDHVAGGLHVFVRKFRDVDQSVLMHAQVYEGAELGDVGE